MALKIAITGGICSGKSTSIKYLKSLNFKCFIADEIVRDIYKNDQITLSQIRKEIPEIFKPELDKNMLRDIIFKDKNKLEIIENIVHPIVYKKMNEFTHENQEEEILFYEMPILFEKNKQNLFDYTIFIKASNEKIKENCEIKNINYSDVMNALKTHLPAEIKESLADFVIENNGDIEGFYNKIDILINYIKISKK